MKKSEESGDILVCTHHEARRDYFILEVVEAGVALVGCEVKSLRAKKASLAGSFARIEDNLEAWLHNAYVAPYEMGNRENPDTKRRRKLLLHRHEIEKLYAKTRQKGCSLIPLKIYFKKGRAKVEIGLAKGKNAYDKRADIKKEESKRSIDRAIKLSRRR